MSPFWFLMYVGFRGNRRPSRPRFNPERSEEGWTLRYSDVQLNKSEREPVQNESPPV